VRAAGEGLREKISAEFIAEDVRAALTAVGDVVGTVDADDVLGKIFSTFCIGK
jgi:tRNA modification GTPase